jgi:hypothetical protein
VHMDKLGATIGTSGVRGEAGQLLGAFTSS